jgi:hypothetical protein
MADKRRFGSDWATEFEKRDGQGTAHKIRSETPHVGCYEMGSRTFRRGAETAPYLINPLNFIGGWHDFYEHRCNPCRVGDFLVVFPG